MLARNETSGNGLHFLSLRSFIPAWHHVIGDELNDAEGGKLAIASSNLGSVSVVTVRLLLPRLSSRASPMKVIGSFSKTSQPNLGPGPWNFMPKLPGDAANDSSKIVWFTTGCNGLVVIPMAARASISGWVWSIIIPFRIV